MMDLQQILAGRKAAGMCDAEEMEKAKREAWEQSHRLLNQIAEAGQVVIIRQLGTARNIEIAGEPYSVSHLYCQCADATIELTPHKNDSKEMVSVVIHCRQHGDLKSAAIQCGLPFRCETITNTAVFEWVNARHDKDRRIAWGMKQRRKA